MLDSLAGLFEGRQLLAQRLVQSRFGDDAVRAVGRGGAYGESAREVRELAKKLRE